MRRTNAGSQTIDDLTKDGLRGRIVAVVAEACAGSDDITRVKASRN